MTFLQMTDGGGRCEHQVDALNAMANECTGDDAAALDCQLLGGSNVLREESESCNAIDALNVLLGKMASVGSKYEKHSME